MVKKQRMQKVKGASFLTLDLALKFGKTIKLVHIAPI